MNTTILINLICGEKENQFATIYNFGEGKIHEYEGVPVPIRIVSSRKRARDFIKEYLSDQLEGEKEEKKLSKWKLEKPAALTWKDNLYLLIKVKKNKKLPTNF